MNTHTKQFDPDRVHYPKEDNFEPTQTEQFYASVSDQLERIMQAGENLANWRKEHFSFGTEEEAMSALDPAPPVGPESTETPEEPLETPQNTEPDSAEESAEPATE